MWVWKIAHLNYDYREYVQIKPEYNTHVERVFLLNFSEYVPCYSQS